MHSGRWTVQAPGNTAPLIHLLISALYTPAVYRLLVYIVCFPTYPFSYFVSFEYKPALSCIPT